MTDERRLIDSIEFICYERVAEEMNENFHAELNRHPRAGKPRKRSSFERRQLTSFDGKRSR